MMLLAWPFVAWVMYLRMPVERAFVWTILGGYLLLPPVTSIDPPLLPEFDKLAITNLSAFFLTITVGRTKVRLLPRSLLATLLLLVFVLVTIPTTLTNPDAIVIDAPQMDTGLMGGSTLVIPGLAPWDAFAASTALVMIHVLPLLIARTLLAREAGRRELLRGLMIAGLLYTLPAIFEIRFSPKLNIWVYGFFQHDFIQMIRGSTFRPIVFLPHALWLAFFFVTSALATASLTRAQPLAGRGKYMLALIWLILVIAASKNMASTGYVLALTPLVFLLSEKGRMRIAMIFVAFALVYPVMRNAGAVPVDDIVGFIARFSEERAQSLDFRFENEEVLLAKATERPLFGWGGWGRNLVFNEWDASQDVIADGRWIYLFGTYGIVGFIGEFGLIATPVVLMWLRRNRHTEADTLTHTGTLALIMGITLFDLLLNAAIVPYVWVIAGALLGAAENRARAPATRPGRAAAAARARPAAAPVPPPEGRTVI
ncbi:MAG: hypothetical protein CSA74_08145 [Rhodobacterales bacterium]|nr:MAG: hypothetical protein CSA74_08145 [Rhodobacterales bacterium]